MNVPGQDALDALIARLLGDAADTGLVQQLPEPAIQAVVDRLKAEADRHWWINANHSLALADLIVQIGQARGDVPQIALGMMARGDALKFLGKVREAWEALELAGQRYLEGGDEIGWARTRIGGLLISADLNRVPEALAEAARARAIFERYHEYERLLRLNLNLASLHDLLGEYRRALEQLNEALAIAATLGEVGQGYLGALYTNIGYAHHYLGDFRQALDYYERAQTILEAQGEVAAAVIARLNIAYIAQAQGQYRRALHLLHQIQETARRDMPMQSALARRDMVECYLALNRYAEARDLARQVVEDYRTLQANYEAARTLLFLATAEAELSNFPMAVQALDSAEPVFEELHAEAWLATLHLRRGKIALQQGDGTKAQHEAYSAAGYFEQTNQQASLATARLLDAQARFACGEMNSAEQVGTAALRIAQQTNLASVRYGAHLLLGQVAEARGKLNRALHQYRAAAATVERTQRTLTITLRPGFLEDKGETMRALLRLHLKANRVSAAFETLEQAKSQTLLGFLGNRQVLTWAYADSKTQSLLEDLNRLRTEHHWYYHLAFESPSGEEGRTSGVTVQEAIAEVAARERQMRAITEQLYLNSAASDESYLPIAVPSLAQVQASLPEGTLLIEYYVESRDEGAHLWAFSADRTSIEAHPLPALAAQVNELLARWQFNIACALTLGQANPALRGLSALARQLGAQLYTALIAPLADRLASRQQLIVVPYGSLHYLPFHLLFARDAYLIERYEIVVLPAAGLITRPPEHDRRRGARIFAHSRGGLLPHTLAEAETVRKLFDSSGEIYAENRATRAALNGPPGQVLHVAAHGQHRLDQPDLSYIELADGQLYTDDLLQMDMGYELVTLSACETGRPHVAAGDELIGLGRGFLYAGARALVASLWPVEDQSTARLMEAMYAALISGKSKAVALRDAQRALLDGEPGLHPAFWGAFQLIGDPAPLRTL